MLTSITCNVWRVVRVRRRRRRRGGRASRGCMALLYRATRLKDRADTHVFTFVVTRSATREPDRDVTSKDFCCAHQRWAVAFSRTEAALGTCPTTTGISELNNI